MTASRISATAVGSRHAHRRRTQRAARSRRRARPRSRGERVRRRLHHGDELRPVPPRAARRRAHRAHRARHVDRGGVRPHADDAGDDGERPAAVLEGAVHPRPREPDQAAHRAAVLDAVVAARGPHARVRARDARDLGVVERRHQARLPRRLLHPHADDPVLRVAAARVRAAEGVPRRRRGAHDRRRRRSGRRPHPALVHHRAVRARGHDAVAGSRLRGRTTSARRLRAERPDLRGHRHDRRGDGAGRHGTKQQIAFYGSTPGYRGVLELHGWGEIGEQLNAMSKRGEWVAMGS